MNKRREYSPPLVTLHNLNAAIENGHANFAHQLVDKLIARRYPERTIRKPHTRLQSTGALEGTLSMLCVDPSDETGENV